MIYKSHIKLVQSLKLAKFRKQLNLFIAEGPKIVNELLQSNFTPYVIFHTSLFQPDAIQNFNHEKLVEIKPNELERISLLKTPNQVLAVFEIPKPKSVNDIRFADLTLLLDDIKDPGNLGTIIRTADWFGIEHILCSENCVDQFNPKVVQSTMGSLARVNVIYTDIEAVLNQNKTLIPSFAAMLDGTSAYDLELPKKAFLVIGSESHGISQKLQRLIGQKISVPVWGTGKKHHAESLNASIAAAILCSEFRRQNK